MSAADAGPAWSAWARVTPVAVAPAARARYARVLVPYEISPGADGGYPDLRVVDARGGELPYALDPERAPVAERDVALIDTGFVPHRGTQAVVDLGPSGALVGALTLAIDSARRPTYFERVAVDASDDRTSWRIVRDDAIVYRVEQDGGRGNATLTFPPTRSRWLRVHVLDPGAAFPLTGARVTAPEAKQPPLAQLPLAPREQGDPAAHERTWTFGGAYALRATAVTFADGGALYERRTTVEVSDDAQSWANAGETTIARYAEGGAQTTVPLTETTARYVRVTVHDGNDAPVRSLRPALLVRRHALVFAPRGEAERLLSGNANASAPTYDLGARLAHESWRASDARAGATVANAGYRDVRPVGERFPWLVTAALIGVAVLLGGVALGTVRRASAG